MGVNVLLVIGAKMAVRLVLFSRGGSRGCQISRATNVIRIAQIIISVQRRATRFILNCSNDHYARPNYKSRLITLHLLAISYWLECRDLCFVYKYMSSSFNAQLEDYIQVSSGRTRSPTDSLNLYPCSTPSPYFIYFFNRVVKLWNNLPLEIRKSSVISAFKSRLYKHYFIKLRNVFDMDRLSTWKTICPSCRSIDSPSCC
jgi:hypothetical protein